MKINKRCLSTFSKTKPYLALGTKSKLFDTTFSLTSELSLYDYSTDTHYPTLQLDRKFSKLIWCEKNDKSILATGHDKGMISLYEPDLEGNSFKVLNSFTGLDGDVLGLDYNVSKNVIAAGSANGKIIFWNLDKIDHQYKCDIAINANITTLAWNRKVSRILCAGTDDGRILVLDIRAKNIAMTLENPEIKTVSNLAWHPDCPTSIFASTNMNCLHSFNLSTDSMPTIGEHKVLGFDILNDNTIVSYSKERINYIDVNTQQIRSHEEVDKLFEASFSHRDPLCCLSNSNGFTTILSRKDQSIASRNSQMILNNYLISSQKYKIEYPKMTKTTQNGLSHSLMKLIYQAGKFNLTDTNRKEVANLIFDNCEKEENGFDLTDPVIDKLVKQDFENIESGHKSLDLKFVLNILQKKEIEIQKNDHANGENSVDDLANGDIRVDENACSENTDTEKTTGDYANYKITVNENPIEYLLYLLSTGKYDLVIETLPSSQWKVMISILLFSNYPLEKCFELFKTISNLVVKDEDKLIMFLLTNNPKEILSTSSTTKSAPKSIFDINEFFSNYIPIVEKIKALRIESSDEFLDEFCRYAQDHGLYDLVKDLDLKKQTKSSSKVNQNKINQGKVNLDKINQGKLNLDKMTISSGISNNKEVPKKPVNPPNLYSAASNASFSSFSPSVEKPRTSAFPRVIPSVRQNIRPPANSPPQPVRSSVGSQTILNGSGFHTRPPVKSPLYSCSSSGSTPNFSGNLRQKVVPGTYGSENLSGTYGSESIPTPKTPPLPHSGVKNTIPKPGQSFTRPSKLPQSTETNYDKVGLSADFEKVYERLREEASKKNNLIIGNKIKDANRRFSVFQNLDKLSLTNEVLSKMNLIVQTFNDVTERDLLRQSVKVIIEDCIDVHENQCNIWMPAIYTLVQLVY